MVFTRSQRRRSRLGNNNPKRLLENGIEEAN